MGWEQRFTKEEDVLSKFSTKQLIPLFTTVLSVIWIVTGISGYGFWEGTAGPTPGFVPIIVAVIMLIISIVALLQSFKEEPPSLPAGNWLVVIGGFSVFALTFLIGMLPSLVLYVVLWLRLVEKAGWKQTLIVLAVIMSIVTGVFVAWLGVPFPQGLLYTMLMG